MFEATEKLIDRLEEWNNRLFRQDLYKIRSLIQGIRVALHIRGIEIPELPQERRLAVESITIDDYYQSTVIKGRVRKLTNKYRINKINRNQIKKYYNILFIR